MIKLDVQPYCRNCPEFESETESFDDSVMGEPPSAITVIRCTHCEKCETMYRYLKGQAQNEANL